MKIRLLAFATARDALGDSQLELEIADGSTLQDLADHLQSEYPDLAEIWSRLAVAVDGDLGRAADPLPDGCEVALLPPVSGGSSETRTWLVEDPIDVESVAASARHPSCGAVLLFVGTVRDHHEGRDVTGITYDAYRTMAARRLETIAAELEAACKESGLPLELRMCRSRQSKEGLSEDFEVFPRPCDGVQRSRRRRRSPSGPSSTYPG